MAVTGTVVTSASARYVECGPYCVMLGKPLPTMRLNQCFGPNMSLNSSWACSMSTPPSLKVSSNQTVMLSSKAAAPQRWASTTRSWTVKCVPFAASPALDVVEGMYSACPLAPTESGTEAGMKSGQTVLGKVFLFASWPSAICSALM